MRGSDEKLRPFRKSANRTDNISLISFATCGSREPFVHKTEWRTLPKEAVSLSKRQSNNRTTNRRGLFIARVGDIFLGCLLSGHFEVFVGGETNGDVLPLAVRGCVFRDRVGNTCALTGCLEGVFICLEIICNGNLILLSNKTLSHLLRKKDSKDCLLFIRY